MIIKSSKLNKRHEQSVFAGASVALPGAGGSWRRRRTAAPRPAVTAPRRTPATSEEWGVCVPRVLGDRRARDPLTPAAV
ncbi:unnamed protein product [Danaus chrysippus]|uniref:(African queen) hypothetical protein n=1 Tax=Danaus chrysippus TaxID=151541 RepID=A0A8J2W244_9NEOP|nr:unnamed protein product [Danaus chrysippus]